MSRIVEDHMSFAQFVHADRKFVLESVGVRLVTVDGLETDC